MPELGEISRDRAEEGMVKVTEEADAGKLLKTLTIKDPRIVNENSAIRPIREGRNLEVKND